MPREPVSLAPPIEKAFLVAVDNGADEGWTAEESIGELASLATTAGAEVVGAEWQNRRHIDPNWYVGKGKAEELLHAKSETGFTILVLTLARVAWRLGHRPPPFDPVLKAWEVSLARLIHGLFYVFLIVTILVLFALGTAL